MSLEPSKLTRCSVEVPTERVQEFYGMVAEFVTSQIESYASANVLHEDDFVKSRIGESFEFEHVTYVINANSTKGTNATVAVFSSSKDLEQVEIPETVRDENFCQYTVVAVNEGAFRSCHNLKSVKLPNSIQYIEKEAFADCTSLLTVTLPETLGVLEDRLFVCCTSLESFTFSPFLREIGHWCFGGCVKLGSICFPPNSQLNSIGSEAFTGTALVSVELPSSLCGISDAFSGCLSLESVSFHPDCIVEKLSGAFDGCKNLSSVVLPPSLKTIGIWCFRDCVSLTAIKLPDVLERIRDSAFSNCSSLASIEFPESLETIEPGAFDKCESISIFKIPAAVKNVRGAFDGEYIERFDVHPDNEVYCSVDGVLFSKDKGTLMLFPSKKTENYVVPDGVKVIWGYAFKDCKTLIDIKFPSTLCSIDDYAFFGCTGLKDVVLPESLRRIKEYAFSECSELISVSIPYNAFIEARAFLGCGKLQCVTPIGMNILVHTDATAFDECDILLGSSDDEIKARNDKKQKQKQEADKWLRCRN